MFPEIRGYLPISAVFVHILRFVAGFQLHRPCSPLTASKQTMKYVKTICTVQETEQRNHSGGAKYAARERRQEKQAVLIRREWDQCSSIRAKSNPLSPWEAVKTHWCRPSAYLWSFSSHYPSRSSGSIRGEGPRLHLGAMHMPIFLFTREIMRS